MRFRPAIFIALMHTRSVLFEMAETNLSYKSYDLSLYDQVNIAFIFAVINAQWYDKFRLPFCYTHGRQMAKGTGGGCPNSARAARGQEIAIFTRTAHAL